MKVLKFKCTLLSDIILNRKSATSGPNETLDFIPGSNFLGIVASALYPRGNSEQDPESKKAMSEAALIFHSGKVRFGDAHPSLGDFRGLKIPASMFYPKLSKPDKELYIHHMIPVTADMSSKQLKQCRNGFYDFSALTTDADTEEATAWLIKTETDFAVKSAYDRETRRSKDEQLFGYQSLRAGATMYFAVEIEDSGMSETEANELAEKISKALVGIKRIGRSRTAQYGLVEIEKTGYSEVSSRKASNIEGERLVTVYADARLIFLDEYGMPSFRPTAEQLGLQGEILWDKSQIRTFRYAPWNFKRQCFDTDRCGLEKGSVIVVKLNDGYAPALESRYVGSYNNEGFGRIIYNPAFLDADKNGIALCRLNYREVEDNPTSNLKESTRKVTTPLLTYLRDRKANASPEIWEKVNAWVKKNSRLFKGERFSSQWGNIRSIAMTENDYEGLKEALFNAERGYLKHGVAKEKWSEKGRLDALDNFVKSLEPQTAKHVIVNLAGEMAKKCKD